MRRRLNLDASSFFGLAGAVSMVIWLVNAALGHKSDGGLPGFSVGMFAVWSAMRRDSLRRDDRDQRSDDEEPDEKSPAEKPSRESRNRDSEEP